MGETRRADAYALRNHRDGMVGGQRIIRHGSSLKKESRLTNGYFAESSYSAGNNQFVEQMDGFIYERSFRRYGLHRP